MLSHLTSQFKYFSVIIQTNNNKLFIAIIFITTQKSQLQNLYNDDISNSLNHLSFRQNIHKPYHRISLSLSLRQYFNLILTSPKKFSHQNIGTAHKHQQTKKIRKEKYVYKRTSTHILSRIVE